MEYKLILAELWQMLPNWGRAGIIVTILLLIIRPALLLIGPRLISLLSWILEKFFSLIFFVWDIILGVFVSRMLEKGKRNFSLLNTIESYMLQTLNGLKKIRLKIIFDVKKHSKAYKRYNLLTILTVLLMVGVVYKWPNQGITKLWNEVDRWIIGDILNAPRMYPETAMAKFKTHWVEREAGEETIRFRLVAGKEGGNIRLEPVENTNMQNIVDVISQNDVLIYRGEEKNIGGRTWYKVKTPTGKEGWISSRIVEEYEE
ncbi:SH3 domain-containing protein [Priestia megaterium]|uniref:SH3 domain-containing protein n=1 Tax=Priestia megaterium TaxID=1404 RepID=UPI0015D51E85|nr:SH3 domain-containing protein [Priestia megaterium]